MNNFGILHLSDIHASSYSRKTITRLTNLLIKDLSYIQSIYFTPVKFICITGDFINSGDKADEELIIVKSELIDPLLSSLQLKEDALFLVPGNHEVKRSKITQYIEAGLCSTLINEAEIERFLQEIKDEHHASMERIGYISDFLSQFSGSPVLDEPLMKSYIVEYESIKLGFVCINSAWRSTGIGEAEKQKMIIGKKHIIDGLEAIKDTNIKICLIHHPLDWLVDNDRRSVEKCISGFDIVLNGHIHEADTRIYTTYNGKTLYNTCGKFDNSSDIFNGYALLSINPYNSQYRVILRQYFAPPRDCFDEAIAFCEHGVFSASLTGNNEELKLAYIVIHSIQDNFISYIDSFFVANVASVKKILQNFDEAFIQPTLTNKSEYVVSTNSQEREELITLKKIYSDSQNILLMGRKEIGKTTLLHYIAKYYIINFNTLHKVPIFLDCKHVDFSGKDIVVRAAKQFLNQFCNQDDSFSQKDIKVLLSSGTCVILFDNFDNITEGHLQKISEFIKLYPNNKLIFSETETISARAINTVPIVPCCEYQTIYMHSLTKGQIRSIVEKCLYVSDTKVNSSIVDKIMLCFDNTNLPKTPFVLSLILSLCENSDFSPINEAVVMEQFMELLLEKSSSSEAKLQTYDFRAKEDFLIFLVSCMQEQNRYFFTEEEFLMRLNIYHAKMGFSLSETKFDSIFFSKNVLVKIDSVITFRYRCMVEYYLAKRAGVEKNFLEYILSERNYLHYSNELAYYTGLYRKEVSILSILRNDLHNDYKMLQPLSSSLEEYNIGLDFVLPDEAFSEKIIESRLSQNEADIISDTGDLSEEVLPEKINKIIEPDSDEQDKKMNNFIGTLLIYGKCLKNLEFIPKDEKFIALDDYLNGLCMMLAIQKEQIEKYYDELVEKMEKNPEEYTSEAVEKTKKYMPDLLKIVLPLCIQSISLDNVGSAKLRIILEEVLKKESKNSFKYFFVVLLFSDLRLPSFQKQLEDYIRNIQDTSLLKLIFLN